MLLTPTPYLNPLPLCHMSFMTPTYTLFKPIVPYASRPTLTGLLGRRHCDGRAGRVLSGREHRYIHIHIHIRIHIHILIHIYILIHTHTHTYTYSYIHILIHTHTHTYTYTYTHIHRRSEAQAEGHIDD
jgi:hypothetical protein